MLIDYQSQAWPRYLTPTRLQITIRKLIIEAIAAARPPQLVLSRD
jgi:hypothetical protein